MFDQLTYNELHNYFYGVSVVICGGHDSFNENAPGEYWIRINNHVERQGGKCHVIFSSGCEPLKRVAPLVCYPYLARHRGQHDAMCKINNALSFNYINQRNKNLNNLSIELEPLHIFYKQLGTVPFTGVVALCLMQQLPVTGIHLTGMTMYLDDQTNIKKTITGKTIRKRDSHLIDPQINYLIKALKYDSRLTIDNTLKENIKNYVQGRDMMRESSIISLN